MNVYDSVSQYLDDLRGDPSLALLSLQMAGEALGISRAAIEQRIRAGSLEGMKVGKTRWALAASIQAQLDSDAAEVYRLRRYLERLASAAEIIEYSVLMQEFGMNSMVPADRKKIGRLLGKVSCQTWEEQGVLLSVLVMRKGSNCPGPGFFQLAEDLDPRYARSKSDITYVNQRVDEAFHAYGGL